MGFDEGRIVLESPNGAYYSGQTVKGRLIFQQEGVKTFRGIYVKFKGLCKVHWTTTETRTVNGRREHHTVNHDSYEEYGFCKVHWTTTERRTVNGREEEETIDHDSYEEYVNQKIYLFGGESGDHQIQPGNYDYPFTFHLPAGCPSSFEGSYGHVRYTIKAVVDRAFKFDEEKKVAVTVMCPLDLNLDPSCREPIEIELNAVYCCCCFSSGATDTVINVPLSGFCPGQTMPIEIACNNKGNIDIESIRLMISKKITFTATSRPGVRSEKDTVAEIRKGTVPGNTTRNYTVEMDIPAIVIFNMAGCRYIDVDYKFKVIVVPSGCHSKSTSSRKLVLGHVPLVGYQDNVQNPLHDQMPQQTVAVIQQPSYQITSPYPNQSPFPAPSPYPQNDTTKSPYPTSSAPYPTGNTSYSDNPPPYPGNMSSYPTDNAPYPNEKTPNPAAYSPYPAGIAPYPTGNTPNPAVNAPYPTGNAPYPTGNSPNPTVTSPYPTGNAPYPTGNMPNPTVTSPYPTGNAPYPTGNTPNPTVPSPYPTGNAPYPTGNTPNPSVPLPYPAGNSPYPTGTESFGGNLLKTGTIGFTVKGANLPNPMSPAPVNPFMSASAPVLDSPDTEKKDDQ